MHRREFLTSLALAPAVMALPDTLRAGSRLPPGIPGAVVGAAGGRATPASAAVSVVRIPVIPRKAWGARPRARRPERHTPVRLTLHHTDVRITRSRSAADEVRGIQAFHLDARGHDDIDYHFLVDRRGNVFEGRKVRFRGDTATEYDPTGHFLVCCLGDYEGDPGSPQRPTNRTLRSVVRLFAWASQRWDIPASRLGGHRDYAATSCPGDELYDLVRDGSLRRRIKKVATNREVELHRLPIARARRVIARLDERAT